MQGRICLVAVFAALALAGCSHNSLLSPDCHSCTAEEQAWSDFSWSRLAGRWRGSMELTHNEKSLAKKKKVEKSVDLRFLSAESFLKAKGAVCESLPADAVVLNGQLWANPSAAAGDAAAAGAEAQRAQQYEAFVPVEGDKVAYGRLDFEKMNGKEICHFHRLGPVMGRNRLALPSVSFAEYGALSGRSLASVGDEGEYSLEFLRFAPEAVAAGSGRGPASAEAKERPPLMIRVFKVSSAPAGKRGTWKGSEERLYRLWRAE
jgi:hypothetical protein